MRAILNQIEYFIGCKENRNKREELRQQVRNILNSNISEKEKEISLLGMLIALEGK